MDFQRSLALAGRSLCVPMPESKNDNQAPLRKSFASFYLCVLMFLAVCMQAAYAGDPWMPGRQVFLLEHPARIYPGQSFGCVVNKGTAVHVIGVVVSSPQRGDPTQQILSGLVDLRGHCSGSRYVAKWIDGLIASDDSPTAENGSLPASPIIYVPWDVIEKAELGAWMAVSRDVVRFAGTKDSCTISKGETFRIADGLVARRDSDSASPGAWLQMNGRCKQNGQALLTEVEPAGRSFWTGTIMKGSESPVEIHAPPSPVWPSYLRDHPHSNPRRAAPAGDGPAEPPVGDRDGTKP